jgi:hypothetical protein
MPAYKTQLVTNATFRGKSKLADGAEFDIEGELGLLDDAPLNFGDSDDGSIEYVSATPALVLTVASADLTLSTTVTGSVEIDGIDGVTIESASGDLDIGADAVTGAVNIGTGAAARPITIGNALSASLDIESGVGAMTVQGDTTIDIDAGTAIGIESAGGAISVGADAVAQALNLGTGAAARVITLGNAASASLDLEGGVGGITAQCDTTMELDAGTALTIESAGGAISIGADAVAQAVNIGTGAAARAIAIGNGASASLAMDGGVGAVTLQGDTTIDLDSGTTMDLAAEGVLTARTNDQTGTGAGGASAALTIDTGDRNIDDAAGSPGTGALTLISGDTEVDNGAGAATGGDSGAVGLLSGDTNCQDAAGTGGDSGAVIVKSGDADSDAGGSGSSGSLTLSSGFSDDANSGGVLIESGTAGGNSGDVIMRAGAAGGAPGFVRHQDAADNTKQTILNSATITTGNARILSMADIDLSLDQMSTAPTLTPGAEAGDVIAVTFASPVASVEQYMATLVRDADMEVATAAFALAETGAGAEVSPTAMGRLIFTTDAAGAATISCTDVAGASGETCWLTIAPLFASADQAQACAAATVSITFD